MQNTFVAIMAGGVGSRFWPASRVSRPKQFLDILGVGKSLIQMTYERFLNVCPAENIFVVTNAIYKEQVKEHLPDLTENQILCEPSRNNTAPCVAYTALKLQQLNPDANLIIAPSDHIIINEINFVETLKDALAFTEKNNALLTLGITPTHPNTGYGYINFGEETESGVHKVVRFTEKPPLEKAKAFLDSGDYLWNAGIFIWKVSSILNAFQTHAPEIYTILNGQPECFNTENEQTFIDEYYPKTPSISIDYAIMEKADNVYTIPSNFGWSDLGTWASLHTELSKAKPETNVMQCDPIIDMDCENTIVRTPKDKLVVIKGLNNYIVVDEGDVLMIFPKDKEQEIKGITKQIKEKGWDKYL
ncbi:MAG: mannose-1-phosphate guanylyltransferase [Bacteroidota bacterium]